MKTPVKSIVLLCIAAALPCPGAEPEKSEFTSGSDITFKALTTTPDANGGQRVQILLDDEKPEAVTLRSGTGTLKGGGASVTATFLGVAAGEVHGEVAAQLPLEPGFGLLVVNVVPDSPAAQAGLQENDVLTKIDDQLLVSPKQLQALVHSKKSGDKAVITFLRKGETKTASATLGAHQEGVPAQMQLSADSISLLGQQLTPRTIVKQIVHIDKDGKVTEVSDMSLETKGALTKLEKLADLIESGKTDPALAPVVREAVKTLRSKLVSEPAAPSSPDAATGK